MNATQKLAKHLVKSRLYRKLTEQEENLLIKRLLPVFNPPTPLEQVSPSLLVSILSVVEGDPRKWN